MEERPRPYVCDACSLLNLVATRRFADITVALPGKFIASELAANEVLYVRRGGGEADANERELVDLKSLVERGLLWTVHLDTPAEIAAFVDFATEMDDREAASCVLAIHRSGILVTDDRKALRVMLRRSPATPLLTTAELIRVWADRSQLGGRDLARVLLDVEERASFRPSRRDPLEAWWNTGPTLR